MEDEIQLDLFDWQSYTTCPTLEGKPSVAQISESVPNEEYEQLELELFPE
ncbi:hypothetical protein HC928_06880 [bacterium]|nr:hypothetical protein [bacterium]